MNLFKPASMTAVMRRMLAESEKRAHRLSALREAIVAGVHRVAAGTLAEVLVRTMRK